MRTEQTYKNINNCHTTPYVIYLSFCNSRDIFSPSYSTYYIFFMVHYLPNATFLILFLLTKECAHNQQKQLILNEVSNTHENTQ